MITGENKSDNDIAAEASRMLESILLFQLGATGKGLGEFADSLQ